MLHLPMLTFEPSNIIVDSFYLFMCFSVLFLCSVFRHSITTRFDFFIDFIIRRQSVSGGDEASISSLRQLLDAKYSKREN